MKRSQSIDVDAMRVTEKREVVKFHYNMPHRCTTSRGNVLAPFVVAIAAASAVGCGEPEVQENVRVVSSVEDCVAQGSMTELQCEAAYKRALAEAERTGPRYNSRYACEAEYGYSRCRSGGSGGFFMPMMAGFMIGRMTGGRSYNPVYQYAGRGSRLNGSLMTANGTVLGRPGQKSYQVGASQLKPQRRSIKTSSRGGFGSRSSARSSWGRSRSSRGWGG